LVKVKYDKTKKEWITLEKNSKEGMYIDGLLKSNLDLIKELIKKDWDMNFVIDGMEGVGKSTLACQMAYYCDPTFKIDRVALTPRQFKEAVLNAKPYQAVVYDEAYGGLSSRATMSRINRALVRMLTEIRMRNLYLFIVLPCFFDLDKYVALWRSKGLFHVYVTPDYKRGRFLFFNFDTKKNLYMLGKKFYSYAKPHSNFLGNFTSFFPIDKKEYKKRKILATKTEAEEQKEIDVIAKEIRKTITENVAKMELTNAQKGKILGITDRTIYKYLAELKSTP